jgi:hypothetical protein
MQLMTGKPPPTVETEQPVAADPLDADEPVVKKQRVPRARGGQTSWWHSLLHKATREGWCSPQRFEHSWQRQLQHRFQCFVRARSDSSRSLLGLAYNAFTAGLGSSEARGFL